jgi:hypothetical protein
VIRAYISHLNASSKTPKPLQIACLLIPVNNRTGDGLLRLPVKNMWV